MRNEALLGVVPGGAAITGGVALVDWAKTRRPMEAETSPALVASAARREVRLAKSLAMESKRVGSMLSPVLAR